MDSKIEPVAWDCEVYTAEAGQVVARWQKQLWRGDPRQVLGDTLVRNVKPLYAAPDEAALAAAEQRGRESVRERGKYDDVLEPFLAMMEKELHANSGKGDRPGWLSMSREDLLLEIYYHLAKLQKAALKDDADGIREFGADVANMAMMLVDKCGALTFGAAIRKGE